MSDELRLTRHLADPGRLRQLLDIESRLAEHDFPPQVVIENTSYCNLRCVHCSHKEMVRPQRHMARALWNSIVEEIGRESPECEVWPTFYGEALILGDELWDRIRYASEAGCRNLVLNSNGTLLDRHDHIAQALASPLRRLIFSLDGRSPEVFEHVRAGARWDRVYPAVAELCRRRLASGQAYPVVTAQFSLMPQNAHEVEAFREYWQALGAEVKVRPMLEWTASGSVRTDTIDHASDWRIACPWGNNTLAVLQDGRVVACAVDYEGRCAAGDLNRQSVREVWLALRALVRDPQREHRWADLPEVCRQCGDWQAAGAAYEPETVAATRPFWFYDRGPRDSE